VERDVSRLHVCLIGFGEVGQILSADLAHAAELTAYDILFDRPDSVPSRALKSGKVRAARSAKDAAHGADIVLSAVTAASDLDAAKSVAEGLKRGAFYVDFNSASPGTKQKAATIVENSGGRYVEAAVMSPFPPKRLATSMLLGGPHAREFLGRAKTLGFSGASVFSDRIGPASATKMCRSVMIKGIEALLAESMLAARRHGVEKDVLASLSDLLPVGDWEKLARYMISRSLEHGTRRAEEMREVAATVREAGIEPLMSGAAAERQDWAAAYKAAAAHADLGAMLDEILKDIDPAQPMRSARKGSP
jgi:3-hydroxyisobutyrate dehydrogenase-like beta-hydroxyacid dehydrogenase